MTPAELTRLCEAAFGKSWKSRLARELDVYTSTVNRWYTGYTPISRKNAMAIRTVCQQHMNEVTAKAVA